MRENKLLIHIESGNVYFDNFNTNESIYDFLLWKQDFEKKLTNGDFSYGGVFSRYINEFLSGIDSEADNRFDLLTKKDAKYRYIVSVTTFNLETLKKIKIIGTNIWRFYCAWRSSRKGLAVPAWDPNLKNWRCKPESKHYKYRIEDNKTKIEKNYKIYMRVYNSTYRSVAENFKEHILSLNIDETD